jgi:hypothetical protein
MTHCESCNYEQVARASTAKIAHKTADVRIAWRVQKLGSSDTHTRHVSLVNIKSTKSSGGTPTKKEVKGKNPLVYDTKSEGQEGT